MATRLRFDTAGARLSTPPSGPMSLVTLTGIAKSHGAQHLFADVNLQITTGRRIAIVGPNGAGKTTLLEIITGEQEADAGTVTRGKDLEIGYLRQEVAQAQGRSVVAEVLAGAGAVSGIERRMRHIEAEMAEASADPAAADELAELMDEYGRLQHRFEQLGGWSLEAEARRILGGLGFAQADMDRDIGQFSGGWMMRVALGRLLLANPDLLLLDEPTNHLDLASVEWLQSFLADYAGAVVLVSHDRDFINAVVNRVAELNHGLFTEYVGDFADFVEQRDERLAQLEMQAKVAGTQDRADRALHRALPLQEDEGAPGPEPDQAGGAHRADRGPHQQDQGRQVPLPRAAAQRAGRHHARRDRQALRRPHRVRRPRPGPGAWPEGGAHRSERGRQEHPAEDPGGGAGVRGRLARAGQQRAGRLLRAAPDRGAQPGQHRLHRARRCRGSHEHRRDAPAAGRLPLHRRARSRRRSGSSPAASRRAWRWPS